MAGALIVFLAICWSGRAPAVTALLDPPLERLDLSSALEYLVDEEGTGVEGRWTIGAVSQPPLSQQFRRNDGRVFNAGFTTLPHWYRIRLQRAHASGSRDEWLLEIGYPLLDHVDIYLPQPGGGWYEYRTGDQRPFDQRLIRHRNFIVPFSLLADRPTEIYLRVQTESSHELPLTLWAPQALHERSERDMLLLGIFYGIVMVMVLYNAFVWLSIREPTFLDYVFFVFAAGILLPSSLDGIAAQFLWGNSPRWINISTPLSICMTTFLGIRFTRSFLETQVHDPLLNRAFVVIIGVSLVGAALTLVLDYATCIRIAMVLAAVSAIVSFIAAFRALLHDLRPARFYLLGWGAFLISVLVKVAQVTGLVPSNLATTFSLQIGLVVEVVLLSLALADRINIERNNRTQAQQQALRAREDAIEHLSEYERIFNSVPEGIFQVDRDRKVVRANSAMATILGYDSVAEMLAALTDFSVQVIAAPGVFEQMRQQLREHNAVIGYETQLKRKDGTLVWGSVTLRARRNALGQAELVDGMVSDITERRERERLMHDHQRAEAATQAKNEFLAKMSHELRTPMNAVIGFTDLALRSKLRAKRDEYLGYIRTASQTLLELINDILDLSRIEAGKLKLERSEFALQPILDKLMILLSQRAEEKGVQLVISAAPLPRHRFVGDPLRIEQVLINLTGNALKFTESGQVEVNVQADEVSGDDANLLFSVRDTGIGLSGEQIGRLFKPFSQGDESTTRRFGGSGLGLNICKQLVEMMGGEIGVISEKGKGSTFWFNLPLGLTAAPEAEAAESQPAAPKQQESALAAAFSDAKVLLVDDNLLNQRLAREILLGLGLHVTVAGNGEEAVAAVDRETFDLVLMDMQMPVMDGLEATRRIRSQARLANLPIIALTANVRSKDNESCLAAGMNDFLAKPIHVRQLMDILARYLSRGWRQGGEEETATPALPSVPGPDASAIQVVEGLERLNGNRRLYGELLGIFRIHHLDDLERIRAAVAENNAGEAQRLVHTLKGVAGNLAMMELHAAAVAVDECLHAANEIPAPLWSHLEGAFQRVRDELATAATVLGAPAIAARNG